MKTGELSFRECCFKNLPPNSRKAVWEITHECRAGCPYCFQAKKRRKSNMQVMNDNNIVKATQKFTELNISDVIITGGEIFYAKHSLSKIIGELKNQNIQYSFSTNHIIDDDFIDFIIDLAPKTINLSLDPISSESKTKYERTISRINRILEKCKEEDLPVKLTSVLTQENLVNAKEFLGILSSMVEDHQSLDSIYLTNPYDIGYLKIDVRPSYTALQKWIRSAKLSEILREKIKFVNFHRFNNKLQKCPAGEKILHIEPDGSIYPCHLFANLPDEVFKLGNILQDSSKHLSERLLSFSNQAEEAVNEYKSNNTNCVDCKTFKQCFGGCIAEIISLGQLIEPQLTCKYIQGKKITRYKPTKQGFIPYQSNDYDLLESDLIKIENYIKQNIRKGHDLAHGYDHIETVVRYARYLADKEGANLKIVTAAAYFHDFEPRQKLIFQTHTEVSAQKAVMFFKNLRFTEYELNEIYHCIDTSSYGSEGLGHKPTSIEAECVRDADWLDAIGARGIARVFAFGSAHGCAELGTVEWDLENPPKKKMSLIGSDPSPIYHFFSKLLWIKDKMKTKTGKEMAQKRHERLVEFLKNYQDEMLVNE